MKSILLPVDGSECAGRAAAFAGGLARDSGAAITLMYVYDAPAASLLGLASLSKDEVQALEARMARGSFEAAIAAMGDGVEVGDRVSTIGHPADEIIARAERSPPDVIVMGSRGLSRVEGLVLGSVSERVLRGAPCPVTIVR